MELAFLGLQVLAPQCGLPTFCLGGGVLRREFGSCLGRSGLEGLVPGRSCWEDRFPK